MSLSAAFWFAVVFIFIIFWFVNYVVRHDKDDECEHPNFARYESTKEKKCVDCGLTESLESTHYPQHQR